MHTGFSPILSHFIIYLYIYISYIVILSHVITNCHMLSYSVIYCHTYIYIYMHYHYYHYTYIYILPLYGPHISMVSLFEGPQLSQQDRSSCNFSRCGRTDKALRRRMKLWPFNCIRIMSYGAMAIHIISLIFYEKRRLDWVSEPGCVFPKELTFAFGWMNLLVGNMPSVWKDCGSEWSESLVWSHSRFVHHCGCCSIFTTLH